MQPLREGLCQAIGQCLQHDRAVVVLHRLELGEFPLDAQSRGDGERAGIVLDPRILRRDEVGQTIVGLARRPNVLLPEVAPRQCDRGARRVGVELDVVADRIGRQDGDDAAGGKPASLDDALEHRLALRVDVARDLAHDRIVKDRGKRSRELPGLEERRPVDSTRELA